MNKPNIYEGKEKYIFISYRHMDAERVYPILQELEKRGLRFWYDAGIHTGDEWDEVIDDHIVKSHAMLVFLSKEYCQSKNCREEIKYARNIEKRLLFVYLEPTELPQGIRMRTSGMQAIHYHEFEQKEAFFEKLYQCKELKICSEMHAVEEPALESQNKGRTSKWLKPLLGLALASAVAAGIGLFGGNKLPEEVEQVTEAEQEEEAEKFVRIILNANENSSVKEYHEDLEILKERLNILTAGEPYELTVEGHAAYLQIPEQALQGLDAAEILRCYLTRPIELYGCSQEGISTFNPKKIQIKRNEILHIEQMFGTIDGVQAEDYGIEVDEYPYIKVILSESCVERYRKELEIDSDAFVLAQDMGLSPYYYYTTVSTGEPGTFYILSEKLTKTLAELIVYNLTHEAMEEGFTFRIDYGYLAEWEIMSKEDFPGKNQCNVNALSGNLAALSYEILSEEWTQGELIDIETVLKDRMDALDQPYAFGWTEKDGKRGMMIKTGTDHLGEPIIASIKSSYGVDLHAGLMKQTVSQSSSSEILYEKQENGTYHVAFRIDSYNAEDMIRALAEQVETENQEVILLIDKQPYLSGGKIRKEDLTIVFDQLYLPEKGVITEENLWIADFVSSVINGNKIPLALKYNEQYSTLIPEDFADDDDLGLGISYDVMQHEIQEILDEKLGESSSVRVDGDTIQIQFDLPIDERLPETALNLAKEVYGLVGFEHGIFGDLIVFPVKENDEERERFRISFAKNFASDLSNAYLYTYGIFANGRLERYKERFKEEIESNDFYIALRDAYPYEMELWSYE